MDTTWDCIVVGAGAAGLSAALVLGRARRRTLVIDAGGQSNLVAHGIGGLLGNDTRPPADFYAAGREELAAYPTVELLDGEVVDGERIAEGFALELRDGSRELARRVLLATGMDYRYPSASGRRGALGRHRLPLSRSATAGRFANSLSACSIAAPPACTERSCSAPGATTSRCSPTGLQSSSRGTSNGWTRRGSSWRSDPSWACAVRGARSPPCSSPTAPSARAAGCSCPSRCTSAPGWPGSSVAVAVEGPLSADGLQVDHMGATSVPGLSAAGDLSVQMPSVANAIAAGNVAAAGIVGSLMHALPELVPAGAGSGERTLSGRSCSAACPPNASCPTSQPPSRPPAGSSMRRSSGMEVAMDLGWIVTYAAPDHPSPRSA
jgi:hypothetical protein